MPAIESIIAVTLAGFALSITPGPSMLYVLSRSIGQSRAAGFASAIGLGLGGVILAVATALGLAAIFAKVAWLAAAMRYIGAAYLFWLGLGLLREAQASATLKVETQIVEKQSLAKIIWQGILVEVLNPKTILFFALFIPPFVSMSSGQTLDVSLTAQLLILGALVPLTAVPSDLLVALLGGTMRDTLNHHKHLRQILGWVGGLMLIGIAINLLIGA